MKESTFRVVRSVGWPLAACGTAFAANVAIHSAGSQPFLLPFAAAVAVCTVIAGRAAGVIALAISAGLLGPSLVTAAHLAPMHPGDVTRFGLFVALSGLAVWWLGAGRGPWREVEPGCLCSKQLLVRAFHSSPAPLSMRRLSDGKFIAVNEAFCQDVALASGEVIGRTPEELGLEPSSMRKAEIHEQLSYGGVREMLLDVDRHGDTRTVLFSAATIQTGSDRYLVATSVDRTEQARAIRALERSERRYRQLVVMAEEGIWIVDAANKTVFVNAKLTRMLGYNEDEMLDRSFFDFIPPDVQGALKIRLEAHKRGVSGQAEFWLQRKDGGPLYVNLSGGPRLNDDGQYDGVVCMLADLTERRRAEEAKARLAAIVESSDDAITVTNLDGILTEWNDGAARLYGYTREEAIGQPAEMLMAEPEGPEVQRGMDDLRAGKRIRLKALRRRKNGSVCKVYALLSPVLHNGKIVAFSAIAHDITEAERMEEVLRRNEERFELAVSASQDVVWDWDATQDRMWWSERFWEQFGYDPATFPAGRQGWANLVHADDRGTVSAPWNTGTYEYRLRRANGTWAYVRDRATVIRDDSGRTVRMIGAFTDVSAAKEAEQNLRTSEERYRLLFERNLAGVFCASMDGRILECNDAYWRMLGFSSREELFAMHMRDLGVDPDGFDTSNRQLLSRGRLVNFEARLRRPDGKEITILSNMTLVPGKRPGEEPVVEGTSLDITETQRLQEALLQAQKMEAIGRLAGGVAHDFNNLLMVIENYSELLQQSLTDERQRRYAEQVHKAALRASDVTRQLLAFSRKQAALPRILDLNAVVRDVEQMLRRLIGEDISLQTALDEHLSPCKADPTQMQQVILNLAVNARDAMPQGGRLLIETANVQLDSVYTASHPDVSLGRYVMLAVTDTGIGIDKELQAHLFEPFFTTKELGKGTGLGLSTVYGIITQNGGSVSAYSEPGQGATFKVYLPTVDTAPEGVVENQPLEVVKGTGTILLVEDETSLREATAEFLRSAGYSVLDVGDGEVALRMVRDYPEPIDLLLTDVIMPKLGGLELGLQVEALRPEITVLYMSGYTENAAFRDLIARTPGRFLQKPFSFPKLSAVLAELLKKRKD